MAETYKYRTQHLRGTSSQWEELGGNIVPLAGEIVVEIDEDKHLHKLKIGDGVTPYSQLAYVTDAGIDDDFDPTSTNAVSGIAVNKAINLEKDVRPSVSATKGVVNVSDIQQSSGNLKVQLNSNGMDINDKTIYYCGKNLLDMSKLVFEENDYFTVDYDETDNSIVFNSKTNDDGTLKATEAATMNVGITQLLIPSASGQNYSLSVHINDISGKSGGNLFARVGGRLFGDADGIAKPMGLTHLFSVGVKTQDQSATALYNGEDNNGQNYELSNFWFVVTAGTTFNNLKIQLQLELNDVSTDFDQYFGGEITTNNSGYCEIQSGNVGVVCVKKILTVTNGRYWDYSDDSYEITCYKNTSLNKVLNIVNSSEIATEEYVNNAIGNIEVINSEKDAKPSVTSTVGVVDISDIQQINDDLKIQLSSNNAMISNATVNYCGKNLLDMHKIMTDVSSNIDNACYSISFDPIEKCMVFNSKVDGNGDLIVTDKKYVPIGQICIPSIYNKNYALSVYTNQDEENEESRGEINGGTVDVLVGGYTINDSVIDDLRKNFIAVPVANEETKILTYTNGAVELSHFYFSIPAGISFKNLKVRLQLEILPDINSTVSEFEDYFGGELVSKNDGLCETNVPNIQYVYTKEIRELTTSGGNIKLWEYVDSSYNITCYKEESLNKLLNIVNSSEIATQDYVNEKVSGLAGVDGDYVIVSDTEPPNSDAIWVKPSFNVADYVSGYGTDNDWFYIKHTSGLVTLYKTIETQLNFTATGNIYKSNKIDALEYPVEFTNILKTNIDVIGDDITPLYVATSLPEVNTNMNLYTPDVTIYHSDVDSQIVFAKISYEIIGFIDIKG